MCCGQFFIQLMHDTISLSPRQIMQHVTTYFEFWSYSLVLSLVVLSLLKKYIAVLFFSHEYCCSHIYKHAILTFRFTPSRCCSKQRTYSHRYRRIVFAGSERKVGSNWVQFLFHFLGWLPFLLHSLVSCYYWFFDQIFQTFLCDSFFPSRHLCFYGRITTFLQHNKK